MKKLFALALALVALASVPGPALANTGMGYESYDWPAHGGAAVELYMNSFDPTIGTAWVEGEMVIYSGNNSNIDHVYIQELILQVERNNGAIRNLQALGGATSGDPANLRSAPLTLDFDTYLGAKYLYTRKTGCRHPEAEPGGILDNNWAWLRATYRIYWEDGTQTGLRVDESNHVRFVDQSYCN